MESQSLSKNNSPLRSVDWVVIFLYLLLLAAGWLSVCGASYDFGNTDFFSWGSRMGKQLVWIGCSITLGFVILMLDDRILTALPIFLHWHDDVTAYYAFCCFGHQGVLFLDKIGASQFAAG